MLPVLGFERGGSGIGEFVFTCSYAFCFSPRLLCVSFSGEEEEEEAGESGEMGDERFYLRVVEVVQSQTANITAFLFRDRGEQLHNDGVIPLLFASPIGSDPTGFTCLTV